ncbi:protein nessun dorma [Pogonomyrmex barbatus]|uniref:Protein nessun dorma n=1 Tax=Pogonomyrmex barbatus TaxID=144034 RepID=A0A6I9WM32_9HYME|nr:protein nessun dorma [Pogonomyrmex barbatus]
MTEYATSIFSFHDKTLTERLEEYTNILTTTGIVPASNIRSQWVCDVEVVIEPVGWQAMWKISRDTCENYNIRYPTIVMVDVLGMDFPALNALVKITAVQDDIQLPEKHEVPLIELYPTINQSNSSLDIVGTAHCVDRLRFFYNYLWMPWDDEEDDDIDWVEQHLEHRIRLYYDMNNGAINKETCDIIRSLISEAKEVQKKISMYEASLPEDLHEVPEELAEETCVLMKLHFRLQQIKAEMNLLEVPSLRGLLGKNQSYNKRKKRSDDENRKNMYFFVWLGGIVKELQELSNKIQTMLAENAPIKVYGCLDDVLDMFETDDTILLGEGNHSIKGANGLQEGGTIIGISNVENTILYPHDPDTSPSLFDFSGNEILLKNICVDFRDLRAGIIVRKDCTVLVTGCRIRVSNVTASSAKWGAVIMPGAKLVFESTVFQGLGTAIVIYGTGEVVMNKCRFENCQEGIRLNDKAYLTATKCSFEKIKHGRAIVMETDKVTRAVKVKVGHESSASLKEISLNECEFGNDDNEYIMLRPKDTAALMYTHDDVPVVELTSKEEEITEL